MPVVLGEGATLGLSLGPGTLPSVRIVVNGALLSAGALYEIVGTVSSGFTWTVRGGTGAATGEQVILVDTLAPLNDPITYTALLDGAVVASGVITRTYLGTGGDGLGFDAIASLDSGTFVGVRRFGGDPRSGDRRFHASAVRGSRWAPLRLDPVAGAGGGSLTVATVGTHTRALRGLMAANPVTVYFHDQSRCGLAGCDVDPVQVMYIVDDGNDRGERVDVSERVWSLSYLDQSDPESGYVASLQTWDDFDAADLTWDELDALALTWDEWDRLTWGESG